jgi:type II secretory pathway predicted ATPase ExeA
VGYWTHWGMTRHPFSVSSPVDGFFRHGSVAHAISQCEHLLAHPRSVGLLVGDSGVGKTRLLRYLWSTRSQLATNRNQIHYMDLEAASPLDLLERLAITILPQHDLTLDLGWADDPEGQQEWHGSRQSRLLAAIEDALSQRAAAGIHSVFLLDHAGHAQTEALQTLAILLSRPKAWSLILSLEVRQVPALPKRIREHCNRRIDLPEWNLQQTCQYFDSVLTQSGATTSILEPSVVHRIHEAGAGNPRLMVQMADYALFAGSHEGWECIDVQGLNRVIDACFTERNDEFQLSAIGPTLNAG